MDTGSLPAIASSLLAIPQRRNGPGQVVPVEQDRRIPAEQVLHGEFLQRERPGASNSTFSARNFDGSRREDHPGFRERFSNEAYAGRRAISAYQGVEQSPGSGRSGSRLNLFV